jgi:plasmid stabilization system protein ParE
MTDTTYRTDGFPTRRFPGWCVLVYARERGRSEIVRVVYDRDRIEAEMRAMAFVAGGMG